MSGLTEAARKVRRKKNMVGMKFNLVNFVLETISILLLLAVKSDVIRILYLLVRYIVKLRQGSGKDRQGMAPKAKALKALKLKPLPRAYTKVGCHHHPPYIRLLHHKFQNPPPQFLTQIYTFLH